MHWDLPSFSTITRQRIVGIGLSSVGAWAIAFNLTAIWPIPVTQAQTLHATGDQWELRGGNREGQHFSPMTEINEQNINQLGLAWSSDIPSQDGPVGTPIVAEGVSYVVGTRGMVFAHDLRNGKLAWVFDPEFRFSPKHLQPNWGARITRGVGYADGKVFLNTGDCRLIAIDAKRGTKVWEAQVCPADDEYTITSAPRIGGGMVFVGPNNQDFGTRPGYVDAYDVNSGKRVWRFHTIPGHPDDVGKAYMAKAAKTWDPEYLPKAAGASAWEDITYDPVSGLVFIGVGGATPWNPLDRGKRRGDELFTNSIVALNARTGEYVWHYQTTPGDGWNFEPTMPMVLANLRIGGASRRVLMEAPKNGFFYVLDVKTGKLVNKPRNFVPVNWAKEIDFKTGRPVPNPDAEYWNKPDGAVVYPSPIGGHSWNPMSYDPATGLVYIPTMELAARLWVNRTMNSFGGQLGMDMLYGLSESKFPLVAWDPIKQSKRWATAGTLRGAGGVLSTAGNLVFQGAADGMIRAYRATDGAELWSHDAGGPIMAAPVTVRIDNGPQILLVVSGTAGTSAVARTYPQLYGVPGIDGPPRLLAFELDGKAPVPVRMVKNSFPKPPLPRPNPIDAERGRGIFSDKGCDACHGERAQAVPGSVPDLRRADAVTYAALDSIVRGGARSAVGMPNFGNSVSPEELQMIKALMLNAAWDAYEAQ
jgi:quinohemoprotein ethanol dehydrogenase